MRWGYDPRRSTRQRDPPVQYAGLPPGYRIETYASGLELPTSLAFTPDGRMLVGEQGGAIRVVQDGRLLPDPFYVADVFLPEREDIVELGLEAITVDPNFQTNRYVYAYYVTKDPDQRTVLVRLRDEDGRGVVDKELLSLDAAPDCCHVAGSMRFALDGALFIDIGDHQMEAEAQNRGSPFGSILRINREGGALVDNPFVDDEADPRVYAYGLRNPFDVTIDPVTGRMFATENGFIGQDAIIEVKPGANYGWPGYDLSVPLEDVEPPLLFYHEAIGPAGIEFYRGDALPVLDGALLFCQYHRGGALHAVTFNLDGSVDVDNVIALGCTSDLLTGPDGFVYFLDYVGGVVYRIAAGGP
jgi:glucose/arabinose dehydrogenase